MRLGLLKHEFTRTVLICFLVATLVLPWPAVASAATVTAQKEKELGEKFHMKIASTGMIMDDPISNEYYRKVTSRIMRGAGLRPDQYKFYIIESNGINAFAVPGGYIYMYTGTIANLENEGQLAAILGHEVAHITSRHYARRVESATSLNMAYLGAMLVGMVVASQGGNAGAAIGPAIMMGGGGLTIQAMLENSRDDESEADNKGRQYLTKAGYNPRDMYAAFKIMSQQTYQTSSDIPTYLSTHPALTSRLATTYKDVETSAPSPPDPAYQAFRDRVLALTGETRRVQTIMGKRLNANKNDHSAIHALGLLAARQQNMNNADKLMKQALSLAPNNKEYLADLGDLALRRRKADEAKAYFEKAGQDNRQVVLGLARSSELLGDKNRAATLYDKAVDMGATPSPEALELAGRFFGQIDQKGKGHYYLGRYFSSVGNLDKAIFHFKEVSKQPDGGSFKAVASREVDHLTEMKKDEKK